MYRETGRWALASQSDETGASPAVVPQRNIPWNRSLSEFAVTGPERNDIKKKFRNVAQMPAGRTDPKIDATRNGAAKEMHNEIKTPGNQLPCRS